MAKTMIFMSDGCEEVEALTVVDLLRRADIECKMVSIGGELMINGSHGIRIEADIMYGDADFEECDMIILPGGLKGTQNLKAHKELNEKIKEFNEKGKMLAAICAAPTVFSQDGILKDKCATCHFSMAEELKKGAGEYKNQPAVIDGNVITARGLGAAIDFAGNIIEHFKGKEVVGKIMNAIMY